MRRGEMNATRSVINQDPPRRRCRRRIVGRPIISGRHAPGLPLALGGAGGDGVRGGHGQLDTTVINDAAPTIRAEDPAAAIAFAAPVGRSAGPRQGLDLEARQQLLTVGRRGGVRHATGSARSLL